MDKTEKLFKEQSIIIGKSIDICSSDFKENKDLFFNNFSNPKERLINIYNKAKNGIEIKNSLTNLILQNIIKQLVENTFS